MNHKHSFVLFALAILNIQFSHSQKESTFSGELTYMVTKIDKSANALLPDEDVSENKVIIYAKDSLLKVVNFNSQNGYQECIKHLVKKKSILLLKIEGKGYAIRINDEQKNDSLYTFQKKCGLKKNIGGLRSKKIIMKHPMLTNELQCMYSKKIPSKYANVFEQLPGIPTIYYIVSDEGLYRYQLESFKSYVPPLSIFMIPIGYEIVSMEEFIEKVDSDK